MSRTGLIVGGVATLGAGVTAFFANKKANETVDALKDALEGVTKEGAPVLPAGTGVTILVRLTRYWPFREGMTAKQRLMEGGHKDRIGKPLYALEDFQDGSAPYVSVAADWQIFPYGQRVSIDTWPGVVFRIVDTGGNFFGLKKVYRATGREPFDICVRSTESKLNPLATATIYPGDHFGAKIKSSPKAVAYQRIGKPTAVGSGLDLLGAEDA